jgi:mannosyltransferase
MSRSRTKACGLGLILIGCALVLLAGLISGRGIEQALLGNNSRSLGWGTLLFRLMLAGHGAALTIGGIACWRSEGKSKVSQPSSYRDAVFDAKRAVSRPWVILTALSVVALCLRLWHLNSDLWYDELISLLDYFRPPLGQIVTSFASQNQHMFYSILAHGSIAIFGESAAAVRLPSVVFGVGSLWALFLLGRKVIGQRESLLACALMTVSYHHIWFSQNARGYMGLLFFATLATWLWLEALRRDSWFLWIGYAIAISLGVWLHMTMVFVAGAHFLLFVALAMRPSLFKTSAQNQDMQAAPGYAASIFNPKPLVAWVLCASITLQLHALALPDFFRSALHMESLPSEWSSPWWVIVESVRSLHLGVLGAPAVICGLALVASGWLSIFWRDRLAAIALVLPAFLGGATMLGLEHYLWPRFFFFSMGFALLIAIRGAMTLPAVILKVKWPRALLALLPRAESREGLGQRAGLILACLLILASMVTLPKLYALPKQDFTGARNWVERSRGSEDRVVAVGLAGIAYGRYFAPQWSVAQSKDELDSITRGHANVWLVYTLPIQIRAYRPEIWTAIQRDFQTVEVFPGTLGGGGVYVCRQRTPGNAAQAADAKPLQAVALNPAN